MWVISQKFQDFGKTYIIGLTCEKNDIINKIFKDYCKAILEEEINEKNKTIIDSLFGVTKIIGDLAEKQLMI